MGSGELGVMSSEEQSGPETEYSRGQGDGQKRDTAELLQQFSATCIGSKWVKYLPTLRDIGEGSELVHFTFYSLLLY